MWVFLITLGILILITLILQVVMKMKLVPPSQLAVVHGKGDSFRTYRGGRVFVLPLINRFNTMDLTPQTTTVVVESAIAKGIVPLVIGTKEGWEAGHTFETVLVSVLGADGYNGLWTGKTQWTDPKVTQALETFKKMMAYANSDYAALTWSDAAQYLVDGKGAMHIMGDWTDGWFTSKGYTGYGWEPVPGSQGIFDALSDSFAAAKGAKNQDNLMAWLKVAGSKEGQEAFNPKKGSICARTDCDPKLFNEYLQSAMKDWASNAIVPSVAHGAAAVEKWATVYKDILTTFATKGDVAAAQAALQQACVDNGVCK